MRPFNSSSRCPKCHSTRISVKYRHSKDVMERRCVVCGCQWNEKPLDTKCVDDLIEARLAMLAEIMSQPY